MWKKAKKDAKEIKNELYNKISTEDIDTLKNKLGLSFEPPLSFKDIVIRYLGSKYEEENKGDIDTSEDRLGTYDKEDKFENE